MRSFIKSFYVRLNDSLFLNRWFSTERRYVKHESLPLTISKLIKESGYFVDKPLSISGWVRSLRIHKNIAFIMVNDGSTNNDLQVELEPQLAKKLTRGTSVSISGILNNVESNSPRFQATSMTVLGACDPSKYPIQDFGADKTFYRQIPHLRIRSKHFSNMIQARAKITEIIRCALQDDNYTEIHPPAIVFSDCEGAGEVFEILDPYSLFQGQKPRLTVSSQFYLEAAAAGLGKVFSLGPTFRAEKHDTSRHLNEFWMLEAEISFINHIDALMDIVENLLKKIAYELTKFLDKISCLEKSKVTMLCGPFHRITYTEAIKLLQIAQGQGLITSKPDWGMPLSAEHEKFIAGRHFCSPVFIHNYPASIKPFYMQRDKRSSSSSLDAGEEVLKRVTVANFDLMLPEIAELAGGSLRVADLQELRRQMDFHGISSSVEYSWYEDLRRFGSTPHGGFGIGLDRLIQFFCNFNSIKETTFIPRFPGNPRC